MMQKSLCDWMQSLRDCTDFECVISYPHTKVMKGPEGHIAILNSNGVRYDSTTQLVNLFKGRNCTVLEFSDNSIEVVTDAGLNEFWSKYFSDYVEVSADGVSIGSDTFLNMKYCKTSVHCTTVSGEQIDYDCSGYSEVPGTGVLIFSTILGKEDLNVLPDEQQSDAVAGLTVVNSDLTTSGLVDDSTEMAVKQSRVSGLVSAFRSHAVVMSFTLGLCVLAVAAAVALLIPEKPVIDTSIPYSSSIYLPELSSQSNVGPGNPLLGLITSDSTSYPGFEFMDTVDPDDEHGFTTKEDVPVPRNLAEAKMANEDVLGWIKVPGTSISTPLLWSSKGNDFYIRRNILKQQVLTGNTTGVTFADSNCDITSLENLSGNTVIYGHNWTNRESSTQKAKIKSPDDKQFSQLLSYSDLDFANKNRKIILTTDDGVDHTFLIFAVFYTDIKSDTYFPYNATDVSGNSMMWLINKAREASLWTYPVEVTGDDKIITLSTCSTRYTATGGGRFAVMGKLVADSSLVSAEEIHENKGDYKYISIAIEGEVSEPEVASEDPFGDMTINFQKLDRTATEGDLLSFEDSEMGDGSLDDSMPVIGEEAGESEDRGFDAPNNTAFEIKLNEFSNQAVTGGVSKSESSELQSASSSSSVPTVVKAPRNQSSLSGVPNILDQVPRDQRVGGSSGKVASAAGGNGLQSNNSSSQAVKKIKIVKASSSSSSESDD